MKNYYSLILALSATYGATCCGANCCQSCCCQSNDCKSNCCQPQKKYSQNKNPLIIQPTKVVSPELKKLTDTEIKDLVKQSYSVVAESSCACSGGCCSSGGCCGGGADLSQYIGYTAEELATIPDANLGLGCGHPIKLGEIKEGDTILDLGSGAGIDCFLAARKVGATGSVIGVDMTDAMLKKARENAQKYGFKNVEFRKGDIEQLPIANSSIDIIISNCVINLAPDKTKVFNEAYRVLKSGGKMYVSDVVLLKELSKEQRNDANLICECIGGALLESDYIDKLNQAGFTVQIVDEDKEICEKWFNHTELPIASLKFIAFKK